MIKIMFILNSYKFVCVNILFCRLGLFSFFAKIMAYSGRCFGRQYSDFLIANETRRRYSKVTLMRSPIIRTPFV